MWSSQKILKTIAIGVCCLSLSGCLGKKNKKTTLKNPPSELYKDQKTDRFNDKDIKGAHHRHEQSIYYFKLNSHALDSEERAMLNGVAQYLKKHPEAQIVLEGHADVRGPEQFNEWLSKKRADSVKLYLTHQNVESERIETYGHSNKNPATLGNDETAHAKNRRVELKFVD